MSFTYDLSHTDAAKVLVSKIRFELGDVDPNASIQPNGEPFTDEEIEYWLDLESDHLMRTVAAGCETLARLWALVPDTKLGPHGESASQVSEAFQKRADKLRTDYGYGNSTMGGGFSIGTLPSNPHDSSGDYSV
jgi:hypothetical protein